MSHEINSRPFLGCIANAMGPHSWLEGEMDFWEFASDFKTGHYVADRTDTCLNCGREFRTHIDNRPATKYSHYMQSSLLPYRGFKT